MAKKKKGAKKKGGKKKGAGKKPSTPKAGKKGKKAKKKGKKSTSRPSTAELGADGLEHNDLAEPARTLVPEFSGNVFFRSFQVSNPQALYEMSKRHGTLRSKRILGPLKKINMEEERKAKESAAMLAAKMAELQTLQDGGGGEVRPDTAASAKSNSGGAAGKKSNKKNSPKNSRPSSPDKAAAGAGAGAGTGKKKKKGGGSKKKKKKGNGSKTSTPSNSRPGTSNESGLGGQGDGINRRGGSNLLNDYGDVVTVPIGDWSQYDKDMAVKRILEKDVVLAKAGKWVKPVVLDGVLPETETDLNDQRRMLPNLYNDDDDNDNVEQQEGVEIDPVEEASWLLIRGERRFSQKLRLKAETRAIYHGTAGFRSLSVRQEACEKYQWTFAPDKESGTAWIKNRPQLEFGEF